MAHRTRSTSARRPRPSPLIRTPIQRIFEEAVNRKMTSAERRYFHIAQKKKAPGAAANS
jgi:hypothetical protein